jgi:transcriptional regulator with XRE-family HTH domain
MDNKLFWERVILLLESHKMTQRQFAEHLGVQVDTLDDWIQYRRIPDTATAYDMAVVLGVTLNYLLGSREADIADCQLKELTSRHTAAHIVELAEQIEQELDKLRPLMKMFSP